MPLSLAPARCLRYGGAAYQLAILSTKSRQTLFHQFYDRRQQQYTAFTPSTSRVSRVQTACNSLIFGTEKPSSRLLIH